MQVHNTGSIQFLTFDALSRFQGVTCAVTTRTGGVSEGIFESLNLGMRCGDDPGAVVENRAQLSLVTGAFPDLLTFGRQVHGSGVAVVDGDAIGSGAADADGAIPDTDAMVTDIPDVPLVVLVADCCAVSLYDPVRNAIGLAHAGWRGTVEGIAAATVDKLHTAFGCNPADLVAGIGPAIGPCCYEVGDEVVDRLRELYPAFADRVVSAPAGRHFDLWETNRLMLIAAGVRADRIEKAGMCTSCRTDLFYSHRAERGRTGRFGCLIMLHDRTRRSY